MRALKFTEETLVFPQCVHPACITIFQKITKVTHFAK